jgi:hypothetical protein
MARVTLATLKSKFETGDKPTGADYVDLIDTLIQQSTDLGTAGNNEHSISGIENQTTIDSFSASAWRMVKYLISVSKVSGGVNKFYATELTVLIDNVNLNVAEYGIIDNDGDMGTVNVSRSGGNILLVFTPNPAVTPVTVRFARMGLKA